MGKHAPRRPVFGVRLTGLAEAAQRVEAAGFDFVILGDPAETGEGPIGADALSVAAFLMTTTRRIGLVAAVPQAWAPFNVARALASFDHLSVGRCGWRPYPGTAAPDSQRLAEHREVVLKLFDSWDDEALVFDKAASLFADAARVRRIRHDGRYYTVDGPLNAPRPLQGWPVILDPIEAATASTDIALAPLDAWTAGAETSVPLRLAETGASPDALSALASALADGASDGALFDPADEAAIDRLIQAAPSLIQGPSPAGATFRDRLGLARPANRYAGERGMSADADAPGEALHLGLWMLTSGGHVGSWLHPATRPERLLGIDHYVEAANIAARGKFDMVFFEDTLAVRERNGGVFGEASINSLDPLVQIAALAGATQDIGLAASFSTTYHPARLLADKFATIDRLSGGRAGWNMVTSGSAAGRNFGSGAHPEHAIRYGHAHEAIETVLGWWATLPPSPQGRPVLIQAGMSSWGLEFASTYGEAIFAGFKDIAQGRAFRSNLRRLAIDKGRSADALKVLPGFMSLIGSTAAEVAEKRAFYRELIRPALLTGMLGERFNIEFAGRDLDQPFPMDEILPTLEDRPNIGGDRARFVKEIQPGETMAAYAERMAARLSGHLTCAGTPEDVADFMQAWLEGGGCDGFIMQVLQMPVELEIFVDQVVPILQRRGLFRTDYAAATLRGHLGLGRPN